MKNKKTAMLLLSAVISATATVLAALGYLLVSDWLVFLLLVISAIVLLIHEFLTIHASSGQSLGLVAAIRKYGCWLSLTSVGSILSLSLLASHLASNLLLLCAIALSVFFFSTMMLGVSAFILESSCCFRQS